MKHLLLAVMIISTGAMASPTTNSDKVSTCPYAELLHGSTWNVKQCERKEAKGL